MVARQGVSKVCSHCKGKGVTGKYRTLLARCEYGVCAHCNAMYHTLQATCGSAVYHRSMYSLTLMISFSAEPHALKQRAVHCLAMSFHENTPYIDEEPELL